MAISTGLLAPLDTFGCFFRFLAMVQDGDKRARLAADGFELTVAIGIAHDFIGADYPPAAAARLGRKPHRLEPIGPRPP